MPNLRAAYIIAPMSHLRLAIFLAIIAFLAAYLGARYYLAARERYKRAAAALLALAGVALGTGFFASFVAYAAYGMRIPAPLFDLFAIAMPFTLYIMLGFMTADALRIACMWPKRLSRPREFLAVAAASIAITAYGYWNVKNIAVREIAISTGKPGIDLKVALVSDIHVGGPGISPAKLEKAVAIINAAQPDMVILAGDIIDRHVGDFKKDGYPEIFSKLESRLGTFAVLGNHEHYRNDIGEVVREFAGAGIRTLRDEAVYEGGIYLIGADDPAAKRSGRAPAPLRDIVPKTDAFKLLVVHNPDRLAEAVASGVDLVLSGHTHCGQLFPVSILVGTIYDAGCGRYDTPQIQAYTSSGLGAWGTPVRTSGRSEIVIISIKSE